MKKIRKIRILDLKPFVKPVVFDNRLNVCIHDTTGEFDNRLYRVNGASESTSRQPSFIHDIGAGVEYEC